MTRINWNNILAAAAAADVLILYLAFASPGYGCLAERALHCV